MYPKKLNLLVMLMLTLLWLLTACGGQKESEAPPPEPTVPPAATSAPAKAETLPTTALPPTETPAAKVEAAEKPVDRPQVTTVQQAAQLLNLRELAMPADAQPAGQVAVGYANYQVPLVVAKVVDFYRPLLAEQGWQELSDQSYVDDTTATLNFTKEGYLLGLTASQMSEGNTMVTLLHYGNIDLSTLPQTADAEAGFAAPNTLIFFSPSSVVDVARLIRTELAAQGWHEYSRPNTATADSPDSQTRNFIQNGLELTAYITTAPAQGNKTSVQYSTALLPLDLPLASEANQLEFDQTEPFLSYTTADSPDSLAAFYRQAMVAFGWTELPGATITPEHAVVAFANEPEQLALQFEATSSGGGQTKVTLSSAGIPLIADTTTDTTAEADVSEPATAMPDLPIPEDAQEVAYDPDLAEVSFTSSSDMSSLVAFYRQELLAQGWQEDKDYEVVTDTFASIDFSQEEDTITLTMFDLSGSIQATLDVSSAPSLTASLAASDTGSASPTPPADAPTFTINDWPVKVAA